MVLLINGDLVNPPTSPSSFRTLTLFAKLYCSYDVLLEVLEEKDLYYHFLRKYGCMDFIDGIVLLGEESGLRIDIEPRFAPTCLVDRIDPTNLNQLLQYIGFDFNMLRH